MAGTPTERELREQLQDVGDSDETTERVTVEWRDAAPDDRPDGMTWMPASDDEPARLAYDVWQAQRETLDALDSGGHDVVAFLAGYGSGKSVFGARWLLAQALSNPGSRFLCMGQDFQKAKNTTYPKLFEALPGDRTRKLTSAVNGPERSPIVEDFNRQDYRLTLTNDSEIILGSADSYERYAGLEAGAVWADEPSHYGEVLHDLTGMITTRLRGVDGPKTQLWTLTGEGYNAAWEILEQRQNADGDPIGLNIKVLTASVLDNPYATERELEMFRRQYEGTSEEQQALHGGFAAATGLVYSNFSRETHVVPADTAEEIVESGWRIYGYDAGYRDPRVLLEIGKTPYGQYVVLDEFYRTECHVKDVIGWLDYHDKPKGRIYCEHEPSDVRKLQKWSTAIEAEKSIDPGVAEIRSRLRDESEHLAVSSTEPSGPALFVDGEERDLSDGDDAPDSEDHPAEDYEELPGVGLFVSDQCRETIHEFLGYKEEHVGTSQADDHCLDSLRYAIHTHEQRGTSDEKVRHLGDASALFKSGGNSRGFF